MDGASAPELKATIRPSCRLFRTGDAVRLRRDGLLERLGRLDRQVKIRGARVELDGVEATLRQHPLVRDVAALVRTGSTDGGVTLVAYVSARDGARAGLLDDLKTLMRSAPPPMRPARLYLVHEIPRLPSSKLDARALATLDEANIQNERANVVASRPQPVRWTTTALRRQSRKHGKKYCSLPSVAPTRISSRPAAIP